MKDYAPKTAIEENAKTQKVPQNILLGSTGQIEKLDVDMAQLDLSGDSGSEKDSTMSRLQQESESFLASLHSTPGDHMANTM